MEYEELNRLEDIVEKLLTQFGNLKQEKEQLEAELERKRLEVAELREATARLKEEKSLIHGRVSSLISSLEKWEKSQAGEPVEPPPAGQQNLQYPAPSEQQGLEVRS